MFFAFLMCTIIFFLLFTFGFIWTLLVRGKTSSSVFANEIKGNLQNQDSEETSHPTEKDWLEQKSVIYGKGFEVTRTSSFSYSEIKALFRKGEILKSLPPLFMGGGMLGFLFFLSLLLLVTLTEKIFGFSLLLISLFSIFYFLYFFIKAR